jgi:Protein of unknown function (DUF1592)/Protein of unknown function (DUF1588)/Protein of unknown function (DUF1585)/Protein of unknown function (DUF1595)/Protein of unknown function (DUF1587)
MGGTSIAFSCGMKPTFTPRWVAIAAAALLALTALGACSTDSSDEGGLGPSGTAAPGAGNGAQGTGDTSFAPRLRLKSTAELFAAIRDVFGVTLQDKKALPSEGVEVVSGFSNNSNAYQVGETLFIALQNLSASASASIADAVLLKHCTGANATGTSCGKAFISNYGRLLFAREVTADEVATLLKVHAATYVAGADKDALKALAEAMLQMPSFLYRTEAGAPNSKNANNRMTPFEVAAALSSFLWESPPDAALLDAAANGKLSTSAEIEGQAKRLLADPKARSAFARFALQWLDIRDIELQTRDVKTFPGFSQAVAASMLQETQKFAEATVFDGDSTLKTLLSGKTTYLDKTLSDFYGFGAAPGAALIEVPLPSLKAGILTQGSFMLAHAGESQTSPIKRGAFVRRRLMCNAILPAPPTAPTTVDPAAKGQSVRDVFNQDQKPGCLGCHRLMNPIGFGFENLDAVGRTRTSYNNVPIDSSGEIWSVDLAKSRPFTAGTGLFETLGTMPEVMDCFTVRMYQYALGRLAGKEDQATIDELASSFKKSNGRIVALMVQIATSPAFVNRNTL